MAKKIDAIISASYGYSSERRYWAIRIQDSTSRATLVEVEFTPEAFFALMSSSGAVPATAKAYDSYERLGLVQEIKNIVLTDERLTLADWNERDEVFNAVVEDARHTHDVDGWVMRTPSATSLSQGQYASHAGTLRVQSYRYVPQPPITSTYKEDNNG